MVDLPGTYSLLATSMDEQIARDFILFGQPDVTVVVVDASRLERNLNLALQVLEITNRVVICLNLMDEAKRHQMKVDHRRLARDLGVPVVPTVARYNEGLEELLAAIHEVAAGEIQAKPYHVKYSHSKLDRAVSQLVSQIEDAFPQVPNARWVALRLLDGDERIIQAVENGDLGELNYAVENLDGIGVTNVSRKSGFSL
jgi:ferrous iron transport protein B